ncbi:MAG: DUF6152 family protein [Pseudohongiellaceae bacterium]|jgi:hypothetical protein
MKALQLIFASCLLLLGGTSQAHHAFSMFDQSRTIELKGEIKEFQWTNPHVWVQLLVTQPDGQVIEWSIEGSSPNGLRRQGWRSDSLLPGMKVTLLTNPLKNGDPGGSLVNVTLEDGKVLGRRIDPND